MQRAIAHIDLDSFFVSVERVKDPELLGKPVIVGGRGGRGVVCSASYEARKFGVHSAMPGAQAARLCPQGIFVWSHPSEYQNYSRMVTDIIRSEVPLVQKASIDEFYLDMTGMNKFFNCFQHLLHIKQRIVSETGLPVSVALATNKLISKIATNEAKPNGEIEIMPGTEEAWLSVLPVGKMPFVGPHAVEVLQKAGLHTLGQVVAAGEMRLQKLLGKHGTDLYDRAKGIDESPITTFHEAKSISAEETFSEDSNEPGFLHNELARLVQKVGAQLRGEQKLTGCVAIKLRNSRFETFTRQHPIPFTSSDHHIVKAARSLLDRWLPSNEKFRLIGVRLSQLERDGIQLDLFNSGPQEEKLYGAIDDIRKHYGLNAVVSAGAMAGHKQHRDNRPLWIDRNARLEE